MFNNLLIISIFNIFQFNYSCCIVNIIDNLDEESQNKNIESIIDKDNVDYEIEIKKILGLFPVFLHYANY